MHVRRTTPGRHLYAHTFLAQDSAAVPVCLQWLTPVRRLVRSTFWRRRRFGNAILLTRKCSLRGLPPKRPHGASEVSGKERVN